MNALADHKSNSDCHSCCTGSSNSNININNGNSSCYGKNHKILGS